jgi:hypothetical protein
MQVVRQKEVVHRYTLGADARGRGGQRDFALGLPLGEDGDRRRLALELLHQRVDLIVLLCGLEIDEEVVALRD